MEFWLVLITAFGLPMYISFAIAFEHAAHPRARLVISDRERLITSALELAVLGFVFWIGRVRGWSIRQLGFHPNWRQTIMGILLFFAVIIILLGVAAGIFMFVPRSLLSHGPSVAVGLSYVGILATGIINPVFEEVFLCGYIIQKLAEKGAGEAIGFSVLLRFLCHVHLGVASLGPLVAGLVFGYLFWRYRQLWPLVVAHSLVDFLALLLIAGKFR
jgi:membrane protease YdiL (CAAX protease family)